VERHGPLLFAIARRIVGPELSDDVVQQTLMRAWEALRAGTEVKNVPAWLSQITRNVALTEYARQRATPEALSAELVDPQSVPRSVEQRIAVQQVLLQLAALPEPQRAALLATEFEGRSRRQIAADLGLSEGAVRQLVYRARAALRVIVTAVTPYPFAAWFARRGTDPSATDRLATLLSSTTTGRPGAAEALAGGSVVGGGALVKGGATILAVTALGGGLVWHAALEHAHVLPARDHQASHGVPAATRVEARETVPVHDSRPDPATPVLWSDRTVSQDRTSSVVPTVRSSDRRPDSGHHLATRPRSARHGDDTAADSGSRGGALSRSGSAGEAQSGSDSSGSTSALNHDGSDGSASFGSPQSDQSSGAGVGASPGPAPATGGDGGTGQGTDSGFAGGGPTAVAPVTGTSGGGSSQTQSTTTNAGDD
jgi:RNA polymerase sigma factor (sigma-70 family)